MKKCPDCDFPIDSHKNKSCEELKSSSKEYVIPEDIDELFGDMLTAHLNKIRNAKGKAEE